MRQSGVPDVENYCVSQSLAGPVTDGRSEPPVVFPRFLRELVLVPLKDRIVVDGTNQLRVLSGTAIQRVLPKLITLMDGRLTGEQLELAMEGISSEDVRTATSLLYQWGMVEDGEEQTSAPVMNPEALAFFRRHVGTMRVNRNGDEALQRLRASEVVIFGSGSEVHANEILKSLLEKSGVGRTVALGRESLDAWQPLGEASGQSVVVSLSLEEEDSEWCARLDDLCAKHQISWLRATLDRATRRADIGPLFNSRKSPCYRCFREVHKNAFRPRDKAPNDAGDAYFLAAMAAVEVVYLLSLIGPLVTGSGFRRYNLESWNSQILAWPRVPGCPRCRPMPPLRDKENSRYPLYTAAIFEDYVGFGSHSPATVKERRGHVKLGVALSLQSKRLSNCNQLALPPSLGSRLQRPTLDIQGNSVAEQGDGFSLEELATILMMTAGIRDRESNGKGVCRWPATAGNLGSVELFVAVRYLEGLSPGLYFYQPWEHSLASLVWHQQGLKIDDFIRRVIHPVKEQLPDVLVIFTAAFHRIAQKYGSFGYRLINFDAGVALSQLRLVARALGLYSQVPSRWADDLIEETLHLRPEDEQCTVVVSLSARQDLRKISFPRLSELDSRHDIPASTSRPDNVGELPLEDVRSVLYHSSRLKENELCFGYGRVPPELRIIETEFPTVSLPKPARGTLSVGTILERRTSVRSFRDDPVTLGQLSAMLGDACMGDAEDWPEEHSAGLRLGFLVLAWRVHEVSPGVYEYQRCTHGLRFSGRAPSYEGACELFLQREFASVPVCIWIFGNLAAASARHGAFGHRQLLLRAGAAAQRLWTAALGVGLAGCVVAGVDPAAGRELLGLDGYRRASLLTFVAGYPQEGLCDSLPELCNRGCESSKSSFFNP